MKSKNTMLDSPQNSLKNDSVPSAASSRKIHGRALILFTFILGIASGYVLWGSGYSGKRFNAPLISRTDRIDAEFSVSEIIRQINPAEGYTLTISYGAIGPRLLAAGAIDYEKFVQTYAQAGKPLSQEQLKILREGSDAPIVISQENAYFLLNFFWAFGLTNQNTILSEGPMMQLSEGRIDRFASTGGWTIGSLSAKELYSSTPIITLSEAQQARLEYVASAVYRPCCNNPTHFPDCNHGMAMLGLLELMASQDAGIDEMFAAAKYLNAFWFPQQTLELALFYKFAKGLDFTSVDGREMVGFDFSSAEGSQHVHEWLVSRGFLDQSPDSGGGCGI